MERERAAAAGILRQGNKSEGVSSVSCPAAGHCVAVGYAASGPQLEPLVFTQRTRGWQETVPPLPAGAKGGGLDLVSCPSIGNCTAAGTYIDSSGNDQGLLLDESNAQWGPPSTAGLPPNGSVTTSGQTPAIEGLSCWAPGNCAAVDVYGDTYGSPRAGSSRRRMGCGRKASRPGFLPMPPPEKAPTSIP